MCTPTGSQSSFKTTYSLFYGSSADILSLESQLAVPLVKYYEFDYVRGLIQEGAFLWPVVKLRCVPTMPPPSGSAITVIGNRLHYVSQDARHIPPVLYRLHGKRVTCLDLSHNSIEHLRGLENFPNLEEIVLDNNRLDDTISFPYLKNVHTLSINNNKITNLERFLTKLKVYAPNIKYLSMLGNAACPSPLNHKDKDESDYNRYRCYVLHCLPGLNFLDSTAVKPEEREEALKRGQYMKIARPQFKAQIIKIDPPPKVKYTPLPASPKKQIKGVYGKCNYRYNGLHSEGNRFIKNQDL